MYIKVKLCVDFVEIFKQPKDFSADTEWTRFIPKWTQSYRKCTHFIAKHTQSTRIEKPQRLVYSRVNFMVLCERGFTFVVYVLDSLGMVH